MDKIKIILQKPQETDINIKPIDEINVNYGKTLSIIPPTQHSELLGLDFESSGHIGFASEKQLSILEENVVPKNLNSLSILPNDYDKNSAYLFVDNNGTSGKISIGNIVDKKIRTVGNEPNDWKTNEYIFKEIN